MLRVVREFADEKDLRSNSFFLFGSRGVGKSTLSQNPDSLIDRANALAPSIEWIILNEVQRIPTLLNIVHTLI